MKNIIIYLILALAFKAFSIEGVIDQSTNHWGATGNVASPVSITSNLRVPENISLKIEPGTQINIAPNATINIEGTIIVKGNIFDWIVFNFADSNSSAIIISKNSNNHSFEFVKFDKCNDGILCYSESPVLFKNCIFCNFKVSGITVSKNAYISVKNCTFYSLSSKIGVSGVNISGLMPLNRKLINNVAYLNGAISLGYSCEYSSSTDSFTFNLEQAGIKTSNCSGTGNLEADPLFVDPENGDFHLQPNSPAIDAGDPTDDFSLEPSGGGGRINMGAYGNTPEATLKGASVKHQLKIKRNFGSIESVNIYDAKGRLVKAAHSIPLKANLKSGLYFYHIKGNKTDNKEKVTVIK